MTVKPFLIASLLFLSACAQDLVPQKEVPLVVQQKLSSIYEGVKMLHWKREGANYRAMFKRAHLHGTMVFSPQGELLESVMEIPEDQFPNVVAQQVLAQHPTWHIEQRAQVKAGTFSGYKAIIRRGAKRYDLVYDSSGKMVSKTMKNIEDEYFMLDLSFLKNL